MLQAIKRLFSAAILVVIVLGAIVLVAPTPTANACLFCVPPECPPCTALSGGSCFRCPYCKPIPGCKV